ncbi:MULTISPECIES: hypothetical protein [Hyphomonas]|uniref:hypothetical protein n=1 Tax=Hyphomonas TaxID=85 RepID=UPI0035153C80
MMNKARLLVSATIVAAFACGMAAADQAEGAAGSGPIGTLSGVTGAVEVQRSGITVSVTDGFQLMPGDRIITGADAQVQVSAPGCSPVSVGASSSMATGANVCTAEIVQLQPSNFAAPSVQAPDSIPLLGFNSPVIPAAVGAGVLVGGAIIINELDDDGDPISP